MLKNGFFWLEFTKAQARGVLPCTFVMPTLYLDGLYPVPREG